MRPGWPTRTLATAVLSPLLLGAPLPAVEAAPAQSAAMRLDAGYEWFPEDNVSPPVRTEFLATYDDHNLYAAWICHDPDPSRIRAHLMDRDHVDTFIQGDHVLMMIDPINDERRAGRRHLQRERGGGEDFSYDMIWASAGRITPDGYVAEIAIPPNQIRFPRSVRHRISAHPSIATRGACCARR